MLEEPPNRILQIEKFIIIGLGIIFLLAVIGVCIFFWAIDVGISKQLASIQFISTFESVQTSTEGSSCLIFSVWNTGDVPIKLSQVEIMDPQVKEVFPLFIVLSRGKECVSDQGEPRLQPGEKGYFSAYVKGMEKMEPEAEVYVTACLLVYPPPLCTDTKMKVMGD